MFSQVMRRRTFLKGLTVGFLQSILWKEVSLGAVLGRASSRRVRPSDAAWPRAASWRELEQAVGGNLIKVRSLLGACESDREGTACADALKNIHNPYYIGDQPGGTQMSGWLDAWAPMPSAYAISARNASDVAAGVN